MTAFFVPGRAAGVRRTGPTRTCATAPSSISGARRGRVRIYKLSCRRGGADCETCVGEHDLGGETVHAIFDFGDRYAVCRPDGHEMVTKRQTYAVVAFDG